MKYLIFGMAALLAGECALAQTTAPSTAPSEPAKKDAVVQPAPVKGAAAAKSVGTKDMTAPASSYLKAQERRRAAMEKKNVARGGAPKKEDAGLRPSNMMTVDERVEHRKKLQSFATLAECETYEKQHRAEMEARATAQHKTLRAANASACDRYKPAAATAAPAAAKAAPK